MKKLLSALIIISTVHADNVTSHTFFTVRPLFQSGSPELFTLFHDRMIAVDEYDRHGSFELVIFGSDSRTTIGCKNPLAQYFMPFGKTTIIAGEFGSDAVLTNKVDIIANYFGVLTADPTGVGPDGYNFSNGTFQSTINFNPHQSMVGAGIWYKQKISCEPSHAWWFSINAPLQRIKNSLGFCETIINAGGGDVQTGYVSTIQEALQGETVFGNQHFRFGKIAPPGCCALTKTGIADIECKLGYIFANDATCYIEGYGGILIPTGNKPTGEFIFEPIVGNNKHAGFIFGGECEVELFNNMHCPCLITLIGSFDSRYLFDNTQMRSFDLVDKQWSRYIFLYPNSRAESLVDIIPGINVFTRAMRISPRFSITTNLELVIQGERATGEFGVSTFARQAEKAELACAWQEGPGIVGIDGLDRFALHTKHVASMPIYVPASNFVGVDINPSFIPIKNEELNIASAAHPAYITHTIYGSVGYRNDCREYPLFGGIGASYEFSRDNTGLTRWVAWIKGGISF